MNRRHNHADEFDENEFYYENNIDEIYDDRYTDDIPEDDGEDVIEDDDTSELDMMNDIDDTDDTKLDEFFEKNSKKMSKQKNKPKLMGKHSLPYDTIFNGKKPTENVDEMESEYIIKYGSGSLDVVDSLNSESESRSDMENYRRSRLKVAMREILEKYTDIKFPEQNKMVSRRKPSRSDFNAYFVLCVKELKPFGYSKCDIFIELFEHFSDQVWNMFTLLDPEHSNAIIAELKEKYGMSDIDKINFV